MHIRTGLIIFATSIDGTMSIKELQDIYAKHPNVSGLASLCRNKSVKNVFLEGMHGSCASLFASAFVKSVPGVYVFILNDLEEAGYFYHDMVQVNGDADILFFRLPTVGPLSTGKRMRPMRFFVRKY